MQPVAGATGKRFDALGGRRLATLRAGRICPDIGASRLNRSRATLFAGPLDLVTNSPRQNGSYLSPEALKRTAREKSCAGRHPAAQKIH